jgi:hypothetical protein
MKLHGVFIFGLISALLIFCSAGNALAVEQISLKSVISDNPTSDTSAVQPALKEVMSYILLLFIFAIFANILFNGSKVNVAPLVNSISARKEGFTGIFVGVGSVLAVGVAIMVAVSLYNKYVAGAGVTGA